MGDITKSRWIALASACAAAATLAACGSTGTTASPTTSTVVVTTVVTATPSSTEAPPTADPTTTDDVATDTPTVDGGTDASAYVGHYQRHESLMTLEADQTGTLNEGANAADGENWAISWRPTAQGITITYERLLKKYGQGLQAGLAPGRTFTARFTTGEAGKRILSTSAVPPEMIAVGWCLATPDGYSPECGA